MMMDNDFPMVYRPEEEKGPKFETLPADVNKRGEAIEYLKNYKDRMIANQAPLDVEQPGYGPAAPDSLFRDILERKYPGTLERMDRIRDQLRRGTFPFV
jgi:hypothetical protein